MATKKFYAYYVPEGELKGVADTWVECEKLVKGKPGARFRGFPTREEAEEWLQGGADYSAKKQLEPGVYFDAGTGRGEGVEISLTDEKGVNLLSEAMGEERINKYGKHLITKDVSNNFGELLACKYALDIAMQRGIIKVFGDSKLVVDYWSKGYINIPSVSRETLELANTVADLRKEFESQGGTVQHISGDYNPADLGFHK
jgi:ribonuclease H-related protein